MIATLAAQPGSGVAVLPDGGFTVSNRAAIRTALERHRLPYVVPWRADVAEGALMSLGLTRSISSAGQLNTLTVF